MPDNITYTVLRSTAELEATAPAWIDLWQSDPNATPFQRPEWLLPWWHAFGTKALRAVTIVCNGALIGLLPMYIYHDEARAERQLLLLGAGTSDYLDGIFAMRCTTQHIRGALDLLCREGGWDVAHLTQLREHSPLRKVLCEMEGEAEGYAGEPTSRCAAVATADLPKKLRGDVRYLRNAAIGHGKLDLIVADASNCDALFEELVREHTARWQNAGEAGVLADPTVLAWHREAIPQLQASGLLRLCALTLGGDIIAVLYSLIDPFMQGDRTQYFYLNGYALGHADLQPGTLLQAFATEHALTEGVTTIDMLRGDEPYKQMWRVTPMPTFGFAWRPHRAQMQESQAALQVSS